MVEGTHFNTTKISAYMVIAHQHMRMAITKDAYRGEGMQLLTLPIDIEILDVTKNSGSVH